jgi:hypothetical protein
MSEESFSYTSQPSKKRRESPLDFNPGAYKQPDSTQETVPIYSRNATTTNEQDNDLKSVDSTNGKSVFSIDLDEIRTEHMSDFVTIPIKNRYQEIVDAIPSTAKSAKIIANDIFVQGTKQALDLLEIKRIEELAAEFVKLREAVHQHQIAEKKSQQSDYVPSSIRIKVSVLGSDKIRDNQNFATLQRRMDNAIATFQTEAKKIFYDRIKLELEAAQDAILTFLLKFSRIIVKYLFRKTWPTIYLEDKDTVNAINMTIFFALTKDTELHRFLRSHQREENYRELRKMLPFVYDEPTCSPEAIQLLRSYLHNSFIAAFHGYDKVKSHVKTSIAINKDIFESQTIEHCNNIVREIDNMQTDDENLSDLIDSRIKAILEKNKKKKPAPKGKKTSKKQPQIKTPAKQKQTSSKNTKGGDGTSAIKIKPATSQKKNAAKPPPPPKKRNLGAGKEQDAKKDSKGILKNKIKSTKQTSIAV